MKGTSFQKPFEFNLLVDGETWRQGDVITGSLIGKNHADPAAALNGVQVVLAYGDLNQVRKKDPEAFEVISSVPVSSSGQTWKFQLDRNSPTTDKGGSLFLVYGLGETYSQMGQLQLAVQPYTLIEDFLEILKIQFRFVFKNQKFNKGFVETKLSPPASKSYATVEQLLLSCRFEGESFEVRYSFAIQKVEAISGSAFDLKKLKRDFKKSYTPIQYKLLNGRINHEQMEAEIRRVLVDELGIMGI